MNCVTRRERLHDHPSSGDALSIVAFFCLFPFRYLVMDSCLCIYLHVIKLRRPYLQVAVFARGREKFNLRGVDESKFCEYFFEITNIFEFVNSFFLRQSHKALFICHNVYRDEVKITGLT